MAKSPSKKVVKMNMTMKYLEPIIPKSIKAKASKIQLHYPEPEFEKKFK